MTPIDKRWLAHLAAGKSVAQIAKREGYSVGTMRVYLHKLYARMGVHNRAQAVAKIREPGEYAFLSDDVRRAAHIATLCKCVEDVRAFIEEAGHDGMPEAEAAQTPMEAARAVLFAPVVTKALKALR